MRHLDLFSGIGGIALGLRMAGGFETTAFCEIDPYCRRVLRKHWPTVPIHHDIEELQPDAIGSVDIITGGYPCQPFSVAGERAGAEDDRHLWPEMFRLVDELRPAWVLGENVAGHISMGLDDVLSDLESLGYACRTLVIPAVAVDARHRRDRLWIVAHTARHEQGRRVEQRTERERAGPGGQSVTDPDAERKPQRAGLRPDEPEEQRRARSGDLCGAIPDTHEAGRQQQRSAEPSGAEHPAFEFCRGWLPEPGVGRVAHGIPNRVDRLKGLGNAVVPQVVAEIARAIRGRTVYTKD